MRPFVQRNAPLAHLAWLANTDRLQLLHASFVMAGEEELELEVDAASAPFEEVTVDALGRPLHEGTLMVCARACRAAGHEREESPDADTAFGERGLRWEHLETIGGRAGDALGAICRVRT